MFSKTFVCDRNFKSRSTTNHYFQAMLNSENNPNVEDNNHFESLQQNTCKFKVPNIYNSKCTIPRAIRGSSNGTTSSSAEQTSRTNSTFDSDISFDLTALMNSLNGIPQAENMCSYLKQHGWFRLQAADSSWQPSIHSRSSGQINNRTWMYEDIPLIDDQGHRYDRYKSESLLPPICSWSGLLPPRFATENLSFSCKVFLGGVPWDATEETMIRAFEQFGKVKIDWPGKEQLAHQPKGFAYIIFESEKRVRALLNHCTCIVSSGNYKNWYFRMYSKKMKYKEVQVIPWSLADSNFVVRATQSQKIDPHCTIFVGALHGMINAEALCKIINDLFGGVAFAGIDTDKFRYPIGSARVTFNSRCSYMKAVATTFVEVRTPKFSKRLQVDPYLEDSMCSCCKLEYGFYFCREFHCFNYFCQSCWIMQHQQVNHKPVVKRSKNDNPQTGPM